MALAAWHRKHVKNPNFVGYGLAGFQAKLALKPTYIQKNLK
jgi:hypothetical protein